MELKEVMDIDKCILDFKKSSHYTDYVKILSSIMLNDFYLVRSNNDTDDFSYSYCRDGENKKWLKAYTSLRHIHGGRKKNSVKSFFIIGIDELLEENSFDGIVINENSITEMKLDYEIVKIAIDSFYNSLAYNPNF